MGLYYELDHDMDTHIIPEYTSEKYLSCLKTDGIKRIKELRKVASIIEKSVYDVFSYDRWNHPGE